MILVWIIAVPFAGSFAAWLAGRWRPGLPRWITLLLLAADLILAWLGLFTAGPRPADGSWWVDLQAPWIASFGVQFHLAADGLSVALILLTLVLSLAAAACSWREIDERPGFFFFNLLWVTAGLLGVFTALDLFLFYIFWEVMMVPMFLLILLWGHENRTYAAIKFFLFTQFGSLLMLAAIVGLYLIHGRATGSYTFDYPRLIGTAVGPQAGVWLMLGFFAAFAVKLPAFPVHSWLPDAHTEAPTAGSIILAGVMLKTGAYGLLRFAVPLFPEAARAFAPIAMVLGVAGILYGALLAFSQSDLKRMVAYTSVSHMGFVLLAIYAWNPMALHGAVIEMICHGLGTGALFAIVGMLQERLHTRDLQRMGGLWQPMPRLGGTTMFFALAALGLPGLGNFVGEFLVLFAVYPVSRWMAIAAACGLIAASIYALWIMQRVFHGRPQEERMAPPDLNGREGVTLAVLAALLLWIGLYPQPLFKTTGPALARLVQSAVWSASPTGAPTPADRLAAQAGVLSLSGDGNVHQ